MADFTGCHAKSKDEKMSLLETFFMKFQSEGLNEISAETEGTTQKADKMGNSFVQNGNKIIKALAPIVGLAALVNRTMNFASSAEEMSFLAQNTGMAVEKFQALAIAAENYGGSAEGIAGSLQGLNTNLQNMRFGKGGGGVEEAAVTYGINLYGKNGLATADELLMNVAKRFESLNQTQQIDLGQRLGLDEGTIRLLQTGVANVQKELERGQKYSLFSVEDVENSRKFERTMRDIKLGLAQIFGIVARSLLPAFTWLGDKIKPVMDYLLDHGELVKAFFASLAVVMGVLALKSALALWPILAIIAACAAVAVVVEDLMAWLNGQDSFFKKLFGDPEPFKQAVKKFLDWIETAVSALWDWMTGKTLLNWGKKLLSGDNEETPKLDMADAKKKLELTQTPWASIPQGSVSTNYANNSQSLRVDNVTINTQATDAQGIASSFSDGLQITMQDNATSRIA